MISWTIYASNPKCWPWKTSLAEEARKVIPKNYKETDQYDPETDTREDEEKSEEDTGRNEEDNEVGGVSEPQTAAIKAHPHATTEENSTLQPKVNIENT